MILADRVAQAREAIAAAGIRPQDAALDAEVLARKVLACDRAAYVVRLRDEEPADFADPYRALVDRRCRREPIAYILGEREFWGRPFAVTPDVLIPRPETELIVEEALELFPKGRTPRIIVDVGTGSGCLAVALALEFPESRVIATDISWAALGRGHPERGGQRRRRSGRLPPGRSAGTRHRGRRPDRLESAVRGLGDARGLVPEVREHEPHVALFGGGDGLSVYARLFPAAAKRLSFDGRLIVEVGYDQDERVAGSRRATAGR